MDCDRVRNPGIAPHRGVAPKTHRSSHGEVLCRRTSSASPGVLPIDHLRFLRAVAFIAALSAYSTIVLGGTVRGMGAGLACPDWPLCQGSLVPDLGNPSIAVEYAHRLAAALTGLFLLLTLVVVMRWFRSEPRLVFVSVVSFAILIAQVGFGALTITSALDWVIVTVHLALGTATFASALVVAVVSLWSMDPRAGRPSLHQEVHEADAHESDDDPEEPTSPAALRGDR